MTPPTSPLLPTDETALAKARALFCTAQSTALAFTHPDLGTPFISRTGFGTTPEGQGLLLLSAIALHTRALRAIPQAALLLGEPGPKGDPLASPRLSLSVSVQFVPHDSARHDSLRRQWLKGHPKAALYIDLPDFCFAMLTVTGGLLNAGFGRAFQISPSDLIAP